MGRNLEAFILDNYKKAISYHEIQAFYQPVIRTSSRQLCSFEALARWIDPEIGMIYPDEFIPVLEREGLIHLLDMEILSQVCSRLRSSLANGEVPIPVSVNLSRLDFMSCDIFALANGIVSDYRIPHDFVYFEITESIMAEQRDLMFEIVDKFRSAGYQIWMDDFGSAYSSLNVLNEYTFDELKLDMSFLRPFNLRSKQIVTSIVKMAKVIDLHTLTEGVETEEQFSYLRDIGCEKVQGYLFGKPLPYDQAMANLHQKQIQIEPVQERYYYDKIGKVDFLSAVPFMTREERNASYTGRELNSIPLALAEFTASDFKVLFYNTAFSQTAHSAGMFTRVFTQEMLGQPQPYHMLTRNIVNLMDSVKVNGDGRMLFTINEQYFEIKARRVAQTTYKFCVLASITNLTKDAQAEKTDYLDDSIRQIYALYERITHMNYKEDTIRPLYTDTREDVLGSRHGIRQLVDEYANRYIYPDDRDRFVHIFDPGLATERLRESGGISFSEVFRSSIRHGQYAWKEFTLLKIDDENYFMLVRNIHDLVKDFVSDNEATLTSGDPYAPEQLWNNLCRSEFFYVFWKDRDRRFLGASKGFLNFYGFGSLEDIVGKNDEEMGWHVHPDLYSNDEYQVIHEGKTFQNMPGNCVCRGENREILASKTPLYDANGEITGLLGYFVDKNMININDARGEESSRRDLLTGLFNSRGIAEEVEVFQDEYYLRGTDFVRIHIGINDFGTLNKQYGFDFGDKALTAFGQALKAAFGRNGIVGRYAGRMFTVIQQVRDQDEAHELRARIKDIGDSIRQIDGKPVTLYLSVGYALFSEFLDIAEQTKYAEMRLHADYDQNISAESRISHASELFCMFDDLPVPYAVLHVTYAEHSGHYDAVFFYVNHKYEEFAGMPAKAMLGHTVRELFPFLGEEWFLDARSAALDGITVETESDATRNGRRFRFTLRQIIHPGYCAITGVETRVVRERKHLLIVDDIKTNREMLGTLLSEDYDITYACDGVEALDCLINHQGGIDLVVLDLYMPNMSGWEVMAQMQADEYLRSVPVIVVTVDHDAELKALEMGALDFIPKPYPDIDIVKARINKCITLSERH